MKRSMPLARFIYRVMKRKWQLIFVACVCALLVILVFSFNGSSDDLTMEERAKIPPQYNLSDVRKYHIYNRNLLRPHPSIRLTNTYYSRYKSSISIVQPFDQDLPVIYAIIPTYTRYVQKAELTNMCTVMKRVRNLVWIVIEDSVNKTQKVTDLLINCEIPTVHLNFKSYFEPQFTVDQRNAALQWIRENVDLLAGKGVIYFADDDNTYDPEIFEEMRFTKNVSVWPVGTVGGVSAEVPIVKNGKVVDWLGFFDVMERKYPIDMAGFATNVRLLFNNPGVRFRHDVIPGHAESIYLESFGVAQEFFEPRAKNCTKVLVWHTQTQRFDPAGRGYTKYGIPMPDELDY